MALAQIRCKSIYDIDIPALRAAGIRLLLADLDNTVAAYGVAEPDARLRGWQAALAEAGITLFILSNSRKANRVPRFCERLDIPHIARAGKPNPAAFRTAMERMGATQEETVMVGDQLFTDMLGAHRAGVRRILVRPIRLAPNPGRYLRYAAELPFRAAVPKGGRL